MIKVTGLDELTKKLDDMAARAKALHGTHQVQINDLLNPPFISAHTRFADIDALFGAGGFKADTTEEFEAIPEDKLDAFVSAESGFTTWSDMVQAASKEWATKKLGL